MWPQDKHFIFIWKVTTEYADVSSAIPEIYSSACHRNPAPAVICNLEYEEGIERLPYLAETVGN